MGEVRFTNNQYPHKQKTADAFQHPPLILKLPTE